MEKRQSWIVFFVLAFFSVLLLSFSNSRPLKDQTSKLSSALTLITSQFYNLFTKFSLGESVQVKNLKEENLKLSKKLSDLQNLAAENKALYDQFQVSSPKSLDLLPANVVGMGGYLPLVSSPQIFVIDVGEKDRVKVGNAVIFRDNLVGKIVRTQNSLSEVSLSINPFSKFAAKTQNGVLGVLKGDGNNEMLLDNVLLSDSISKDELILTGADLKIDSTGLPSNLIVGKIVSVDRNPSDLFQKAKVSPLINFTKISKVFVVREIQ